MYLVVISINFFFPLSLSSVGSNSVNVFLGLGLPWVIKSLYLASKGSSLRLNGNNIFFSVVVFLGCGMVALALLVLRRFVRKLFF